MFRNYLRIAFRNLWKNPLYSLINVTGLAIGMTCVVLVVLFVKNEFSFDKFHKKAPQLYRIVTTVTNKEGEKSTTGSSGQVQGPAFKEAILEIQDYVRFWNIGGFNIVGEQKAFILQGLFADSTFFKLFSFPMLHGDPQTALSDPFFVVISESTALKYFGKTDVLGKTLKVEEQGLQLLTITGVAKDVPANSSIRFDVLLSFQFVESFFKDANWLNQYLSTFVILHPLADPKKVEQKFDAVFQAKAKEQVNDPKRSQDFSTELDFGLQSISDIHLSSQKVTSESGIWEGSSYTISYLLSGIAAFILLMACINFINLGIAHSMKRAKEIGIRKISGSNRWQIIGQFLVEAGLLCITAFLVAIIFSQACLSLFNSLIGRQLKWDIAKDVEIWIAWLGIIVISIVMAGLYPALVLSRFNAVQVLYNKQKLRGRSWLGKSLIVFQFTLAVGLIISTMVYFFQLNFILNKELGYNPSGIIKVRLPPQRDPDQLVKLFRSELATEPTILRLAGENSWTIHPVKVREKEIQSLKLRIDEFYLPAMEIPLKQGRNFSTAFGTDSLQAVIVNETFVRLAGWENPIGQQVQLPGEWEGDLYMTVVGVIKDYHYNSIKQKIGPQVMVMKHYENLWIKTQKGKAMTALAAMEKVYKKFIPDNPFHFSFLKDDLQKQYGEEKQWQQIIGWATAISIFICCLGLFGLSYLAARQRTREIGIRKVLGASISGIARLLSKDFLKLVFIAFFLASPVSWFFMNRWLENFAYRIDISWWIFLMAGFSAVLIASITLSFQAIKAATANPVKSLRTE